jgi:hypothetical protein
VCEVVQDAEEPACFAPVTVRGEVFDLESDAAVAGARVVALDVNNAPVSAVAISDTNGTYALAIPSTRTADGTPIGVELTLRADASGYQSFPAGLRQSLPIDTATAIADGDGFLVESALTAIGLEALPEGSGTASISGTIELPPDATGVLVVAEGPEARSTIADRSGEFTVFNLDVVAPGALGAEAVTGDPLLQWQDDASEDQYDIRVVDSFGNIIWTETMTGINGGTAEVTYAGPALESGAYYQFRVVSSRSNGPTDRCEISQTEDLEGVFFVP